MYTILYRSVCCCSNNISTISFGFAIVKREKERETHTHRHREHLVSYGARTNRNGFCPYVVKCTELQSQSNSNIIYISLYLSILLTKSSIWLLFFSEIVFIFLLSTIFIYLNVDIHSCSVSFSFAKYNCSKLDHFSIRAMNVKFYR